MVRSNFCRLNKSFVLIRPFQIDTISASGEVEDEGPPEGEYITRKSSIDGGESPVWGKRMKGSLKLTSSVGSTFAAPNLSVSFLLVFRVACPGVGNNAELVSHLLR